MRRRVDAERAAGDDRHAPLGQIRAPDRPRRRCRTPSPPATRRRPPSARPARPGGPDRAATARTAATPALDRRRRRRGRRALRPLLVAGDDEPDPGVGRPSAAPPPGGARPPAGPTARPAPPRSILAQAPWAPSRSTSSATAGRLRPARSESAIRACRSRRPISRPACTAEPGCSPRRMASATRQIVRHRHVPAVEIGDRPGQPQHLVHTPRAQPAAVHRVVDRLQAVRERQVPAQVASRHLAVGPPPVPASRRSCRCRASRTRPATTADVSPRCSAASR